jgi:hypothetical protein
MNPWDWIVDETREAERVPSWRDLHHFMRAVRRSYRKDRWAVQPRLVGVWSENNTVNGILAPVLHEYGVTFLSLHGYGSSTKVHEGVDLSLRDADRQRLVLYVGGWDCSDLHMRDEGLPNRLAKYGGRIEVRRTALTEDLIRSGHLPSFRAKTTGSRYGWFSRRYGKCAESWTRCSRASSVPSSGRGLRPRSRGVFGNDVKWPRQPSANLRKPLCGDYWEPSEGMLWWPKVKNSVR